MRRETLEIVYTGFGREQEGKDRGMNPYDRAHELARALRESEPFRAMKSAKEKLAPDPQGRRMLDDFHLKQLEFERKKILGQEPSVEEQESLQKLYEILQLHETVRSYLMAEYQLGVMVQDVQKILGEVLEEVSIAPEGRSSGGALDPVP